MNTQSPIAVALGPFYMYSVFSGPKTSYNGHYKKCPNKYTVALGPISPLQSPWAPFSITVALLGPFLYQCISVPRTSKMVSRSPIEYSGPGPISPLD